MDKLLLAFLLALPLLDEAPQPQPVAATPHIDALTSTTSPLSALADQIIECESHGRNVSIIDSNGLPSRGVAQFQDTTWGWMSAAAGVEGSSLEPDKARQVLLWALKNGYGYHWTCFDLVRPI